MSAPVWGTFPFWLEELLGMLGVDGLSGVAGSPGLLGLSGVAGSPGLFGFSGLDGLSGSEFCVGVITRTLLNHTKKPSSLSVLISFSGLLKLIVWPFNINLSLLASLLKR